MTSTLVSMTTTTTGVARSVATDPILVTGELRRIFPHLYGLPSIDGSRMRELTLERPSCCVRDQLNRSEGAAASPAATNSVARSALLVYKTSKSRLYSQYSSLRKHSKPFKRLRNKQRGIHVWRAEGNPNEATRGEDMSKLITHNHNDDGVDRRGFLQCMAWAEPASSGPSAAAS